MSRQWKQGDLAIVTGQNGAETVALWGGWSWFCAQSVTPIDFTIQPRPLVVLDPENVPSLKPFHQALVGRLGVGLFYDDLQDALRQLLPKEAPPQADTGGEYIHCVMYRDHRMGTLCDSGAWGTPALFTAVTENATCPGCRKKLDGGAREPRSESFVPSFEGDVPCPKCPCGCE